MEKQRFEDLIVWQKAFKLTVNIYKVFQNCKDFGFKDQITRSSLSIPSNISEGYERESNKEFIRFLNIAKESCGELRAQLYIAIEISYLSKELGKEFIAQALEISYMISSLIKKRKTY